MHTLRVEFSQEGSEVLQCLEVPDIKTALVVADINMEHGEARIRDGDSIIARLEKRPGSHAPYWRVS